LAAGSGIVIQLVGNLWSQPAIAAQIDVEPAADILVDRSIVPIVKIGAVKDVLVLDAQSHEVSRTPFSATVYRAAIQILCYRRTAMSVDEHDGNFGGIRYNGSPKIRDRLLETAQFVVVVACDSIPI